MIAESVNGSCPPSGGMGSCWGQRLVHIRAPQCVAQGRPSLAEGMTTVSCLSAMCAFFPCILMRTHEVQLLRMRKWGKHLVQVTARRGIWTQVWLPSKHQHLINFFYHFPQITPLAHSRYLFHWPRATLCCSLCIFFPTRL